MSIKAFAAKLLLPTVANQSTSHNDAVVIQNIGHSDAVVTQNTGHFDAVVNQSINHNYVLFQTTYMYFKTLDKEHAFLSSEFWFLVFKSVD